MRAGVAMGWSLILLFLELALTYSLSDFLSESEGTHHLPFGAVWFPCFALRLVSYRADPPDSQLVGTSLTPLPYLCFAFEVCFRMLTRWCDA